MQPIISDKLSIKEKQCINEFVNKYLDKNFRIDWNVIKLSRSDSYEHNKMVSDICLWLFHNNIPFTTQCRFNTQYRPDIMCPIRHIKRIIEVRHTETDKRSFEKFTRIPEELQNEIIYVDAKQIFKQELIL